MSDVPAHSGGFARSAVKVWVARLRDLTGGTLGGNGLALVAGSAITAMLGLMFWLVVARVFTQEQVGVGAALIATMMALSHAAQLNLRNLVHRYVPSAGPRAGQLVARSFAGAALGALVLGLGFVLLAGRISPELAFVGQSFWLGFGFVAALVAWTLYAMQEAVLTGLRLSRIVPVQSLVYSVAKIALVLLAGTAAGLTAFGGGVIVVVWVLPAALIGIFVHHLIRRELSTPARTAGPAGEVLDRAGFLRFFGWDYLGSMSISVAYGVIPLLVLSITGAAASAQYQMAWAIAYSLYLVGRHLGAAMQAEIGRAPERRQALYASTLVYTLALVTPAVAVIVLFAPQIMALFGADYVAEGGRLLRLFALATLPLSLVTVLLAIARAENLFSAVAAAQVATLVLAVGLGAVMLGQMGTVGMAWAWLLTQCAVMVAGLLWLFFTAGRGAMTNAAIDIMSAVARLVSFARGLLSAEGKPSLSDAQARLGRSVTKRSDTARGMAALSAEHQALEELQSDRRLRGFQHLLPQVERFDGKHELRMSRLLGAEGRDLSGDQLAAGQVAADKMAAFHHATCTDALINSRWISEWVDVPLAQVALSDVSAQIIRDQLVAAFSGSRQALGLGHGDFCLDNLLFETDRMRRNAVAVTGILDWGQSRPDAPALLDPLHLVLTLRMRASDRQFGQVVAGLWAQPDLSPDEERLVGAAWSAADADARKALVLMVWLQHAANNMEKSARYQAGTFWHFANVRLVVDAVAPPAPPKSKVKTKPLRVERAVSVRSQHIMVESQPRWQVLASGLFLTAGVLIWGMALPGLQPDTMGPLGLVTILPNAMILAYGLTIAGFVLSLSGGSPTRFLPPLFVLALVLVLHATPAISYETLRYSWAWKHVGVIDFIMRTGELDPTAQFLSAYFNWPTFFVAMAGLATLLGLDPLGIADLARFFPVLLNLGFAAALIGTFGNLGADRRTSYVAVGLFLLGNWVGQDYFSPQGTAFLFNLCLLYLVTGPLAQRTVGWRGGLIDRVRAGTGFSVEPDDAPQPNGWLPLQIIAALVLIGLVVATHQLTPLLMLSALFGLFVIGRLRIDYFLFGLVAQMLWLFYFADSFMAAQLVSILDSLGDVGGDTVGKLVNLDLVSDSQRTVAVASRLLSGFVILLGLAGGLLRLWHRKLDLTALVLLLAPAPLLVVTPYGGEIVFRAYFYALPFVAYFAAMAFAGRGRMGWVAGLALGLAMTAMVPGFLLANNGKDEQYRFTALEVAASDWLYSQAQPGELLVEGSRSYPSQFRNYENFIYVPLSEELPEIAPELTGDAAGLVTRWLSEAPNGGYVIITRSMKALFDSLGLLPAGELERVEQALLAAPHLKVAYSNRDATVFTLRD